MTLGLPVYVLLEYIVFQILVGEEGIWVEKGNARMDS